MSTVVQFTKTCIKCNINAGIPDIILFKGYDEKLDFENPMCLNEVEIIDILYNWHEDQNVKCEFCKIHDKFVFSNILINNKPARKNNINHYDYLSRLYLLAIFFEEYCPIIYHINPNTYKIIKSERIKNRDKSKGVLYIDEAEVKVMITDDFVNGLLVFVGRIGFINYNSEYKVYVITGTTKHPLDGSVVDFKLNLNVDIVGGKNVKNKDNYYIEINPCISVPDMIRGILLTNTVMTNGVPSEKTAYKGELY